MPIPQAGQTHCMNKNKQLKVLKMQKGPNPETIEKVYLFHTYKPILFFPNSYNPGVQNTYCFAACIIVCVFYMESQYWVLYMHASGSPVRVYGPFYLKSAKKLV